MYTIISHIIKEKAVWYDNRDTKSNEWILSIGLPIITIGLDFDFNFYLFQKYKSQPTVYRVQVVLISLAPNSKVVLLIFTSSVNIHFNNYRLIKITKLDATIYYAQALFKPALEL